MHTSQLLFNPLLHALKAYFLRALPGLTPDLLDRLRQLDFHLQARFPQHVYRQVVAQQAAGRPQVALSGRVTQLSHSVASEQTEQLVDEPLPRTVREVSVPRVVQCQWPPVDSFLCTWRSPEGLPCLPMTARCRGPLLLISLFNGVGCAAVALPSLGLQFALVCVELDLVLSRASEQCFELTSRMFATSSCKTSLPLCARQSFG